MYSTSEGSKCYIERLGQVRGKGILWGGGMYLRWAGKASLIGHLSGDKREVILERVTL